MLFSSLFLAYFALVLGQRGPIPFDLGEQPVPVREYRSFSGQGNNIANPTWGMAGTVYVWDGLTPSFYVDPINDPHGIFSIDPNRTNERLISTKLAKATFRGQTLADNFLNQLHTEWGHFMTIDLCDTMVTNLQWAYGPPVPDAIEIRTDIGDDAINYNGWAIPEVTVPPGLYPGGVPGGTGPVSFNPGGPFAMGLFRSGDARGTGTDSPTDDPTPAQRINRQTHFLDGSMIYGVSDDPALWNGLWNPATGYLHIGQPFPYSPATMAGFAVPEQPFLNQQEQEFNWLYSGSSLINKNPSLRFFTVLYQMEHNRRVKLLTTQNPHWPIDIVFQEARRFVVAHIQATSFREYLGSTLGNPLNPYTGYNASINPTLGILFPTATMRYGHTEATPQVTLLESDGITPCTGGLHLLRDIVYLPTRWLVSNPHTLTTDEYNCFIRGFSLSLAGKVDAGFVDDVRNFLIGGTRQGSDLFATNIYRGHDNGLPDYQAVRVNLGLPPKTSYADITSDPLVQAALEDIYGDFSTARIDVYVGMVSEDIIPGAGIGETLRASMNITFSRLRDGDRFYYENPEYMTPEEIAEVYGIKLRDLMVLNFGMGENDIPTSAFFVEQRQLDRPVSGTDAFLFPPLQNHSTGLPWYTTNLAPFYQLSWAIERHNGPQNITFQIQTSTIGWVGLGFDPDLNTMTGADIVLCRYSNVALGIAECRDSKALDVGEPALDVIIGGTDDVQLHYFAQVNGFTTVVFSRLVDTGDVLTDHPITDAQHIIFAFNPETNELRYHGPTRSTLITHMDFLSLYVGPPTQIFVSLGVQIWLYVSAGVGVIQALFIILLILVKSDYFHFQTPEFCVLICLGAIMGHVATILIVHPYPTDGMCWANLWLFGMSFWLVFTCLFAKVFRIWWTVQAAEKMKIQPVKIEMLLIPVLVCCILEGVFQACWDGIWVVRPNVDTYVNPATNEFTYYCGGNTWMWLGSVLVRAMFLLIGVWLSLETRKMQKSLNWSQEVALAMYTMAIFCFVLIPLGFAISNSPTLVIILKGIGYTYSYILILCVVFSDTLIRIFSGKPARTLDSSAILSSNSGSMTGGSSSDVSVGIKSTKSVS